MRRPIAIVTVLTSLTWVAANVLPVAHAGNTIRVTTARDELNNDGDCSLREALKAANTNAPEDDCRRGDGADRIVLQGRTYDLTIAGANEQDGATGDLDTKGQLEIVGEGPGQTAIVGSAAFGDRIFDVTTGRLELSNLRVSQGRAPNDLLGDPTQGGGVLKRFGASLALHGVTVSHNRSGVVGSGIAAAPSTDAPAPPPAGTTTIRNSEIVRNRNGGVFSEAEAKIVFVNSSASSNDNFGLVAVDTKRVTVLRSTTSRNVDDGTIAVDVNHLRVSRLRSSKNGTNDSGASGVVAVDVAHATFDHLNVSRNTDYGLVTVDTSDIEVSDGAFVGNENGLVVVDAAGVTVEGVRVARSDEVGATFVDVSDVEMSDLVVANSGGEGIQIVEGTDVALRRITSSGNEDNGIVVVNVAQNRFKNTVSRDNEGTGLLMVSVSEPRLDHVRLKENVTTDDSGGGLLLIDAIDPKLTNVVAAGNRADSGGGMIIGSTVNMLARNLSVSDNRAGKLAGGIQLFSAVDGKVMRSRIAGNTSRGSGGGLMVATNTNTLLKSSTVAGNEALGETTVTSSLPSGSGAGMLMGDNEGLRILGSTISGNDARAHGGGLAFEGDGVGPIDTQLVNSTVSGNNSGGGANRRGGGLYLDNSFVSLLNSTITRNTSPKGGGIFAHLTPEDPPDADPNNDPEMIVRGKNTIVAGQHNGGDCRGNGTFDSAGHNLSTSGSCFSGNNDRQGKPKLGSLADNGGPTKTHLLLAGSPARNHGDNNGCPNRDQRGRRRPATNANRCDIGAVEMPDGSGAAAAGASSVGASAGGGAGDCASADSEAVDERLGAIEEMVEEALADTRTGVGGSIGELVPGAISSSDTKDVLADAARSIDDATSIEPLEPAC